MTSLLTMTQWIMLSGQMVGLAYLTSASAQRKRYRGQSLTGFERLMESYPGPVAIVAALGLLKARKAFHVPKLKT